MTTGHDDAFLAERRRLLALAYAMLGRTGDAEDVVQDAWVRWNALAGTAVRRPAAMLTTITTRLAIDRHRAMRRDREGYPGPWLPEPVTDDGELGRILAAERVGYALLAALERLTPVERAVLLLRDVFDLDYPDVAEVVGKTPGNCRQIAVRARERATDTRRRRRPSRAEVARLQWAFGRAVRSGDLSRISRLLHDDVVHVSDGGPSVSAARKPILGAARVARLWAALGAKRARGTRVRPVTVGGDPALRVTGPGGVASLVVLEPRDGRIACIRLVSNPDKLGAATRRPGWPGRIPCGARRGS